MKNATQGRLEETMERLTKRTDDGKVVYALLGPGTCVDPIDLLKVWGDHLAAYEDTGLEPEEIDSEFINQVIEENRLLKELSQAEKDGRLVVLPCKLHESIFYIEDGELFDEVSIGQKAGEWKDSLLYECQYGFCFYAEDIGKTVFLTREEAEAALKKREEADNEAG